MIYRSVLNTITLQWNMLINVNLIDCIYDIHDVSMTGESRHVLSCAEYKQCDK